MSRYHRTLFTAALITTVVAGTAGWASADTQLAVTGPPPGSAAWLADDSLGRELPDPSASTPDQVAHFFGTLTGRQQQQLAHRHPLVVGNLDGAPVSLRYEANHLALQQAGKEYEDLAAPGHQILAFDPRGRGQVAEVYGDLAATEHVSVVVPGSDTDAGHFAATATMAKNLRAATDDRTAVIAWAGYTTPVGIGLDAATSDLAEAGAPRLTRLTEGLEATGAAEPVLFCHSYGSVVCGLAARDTPYAADLVVTGSPGMHADTAADLHTDARVWAAKDPGDWIDDVPNVRFAGLGHGEDPTDPSFGARIVPARDAKGHTGYYTPGTESLRTFASIALGEI
ncbi:alpha/beta hydrolase [Streptomyces sp. NPDC050738]|uniref:alpha/beta hydrolase n=1 Tax=Streptomyces sp. NPDC050738 TaxID=3154744 RepID=UPI003426E34B